VSYCPICGTEVSRRHDLGRPPTYCCSTHKRTAERRRMRYLAKVGLAAERAMRGEL
jgi:hypothetical protein